MKHSRVALLLIALILTLSLMLSGCDLLLPDSDAQQVDVPNNVVICGEKIPAYSSDPYYVVNGNVPLFTEAEITTDAFYEFTDLDALGRAGEASGCIGPETLPDDAREEIDHIYPSGWKYNGKSNNNRYDASTGVNQYIYNRAHLLANQLIKDDVDERNFFTGTCSMNQKHMVRFENQVADYVKEDGGHVMYRVTPYFEGNNLICSGVLMEGYSVEDMGESVEFCVFIYNVQPNIYINYLTGENCLWDEIKADGDCRHTKTELRNERTATCAVEGYTGDTWCTECQTQIQGGTVISKSKEHSFGEWEAIEGTDKQKRTCAVCGEAQEKGDISYTVVTSPEANCAYKLVGEHDTVRFFNGTITTTGNSKGLNTTTDISEAADVYLEYAGSANSYYIYLYVDGTVTYLTVTGSTTTSLALSQTKGTVWTVNTEGYLAFDGRVLGCYSGEFFRYYSKVSEKGEYRPIKLIKIQ